MPEKLTFCRLCESLCGLSINVEDGEITKVRPDSSHPITGGFACPKGIAMAEIQNDPDRVLYPQRRRPDGSLERIDWNTAITEIGARLRTIRGDHGTNSVGVYFGNPTTFSSSWLFRVAGFGPGLGTPHIYSAGSQDTNSRLVASKFLYGSPLTVPVPDIPRTQMLVIVGANPLISHGSLISGGVIKDDLKAIRARGGRVVVIDPRRTETAKTYEHVALLPDSDAWFMLSLLHVIFAEGLDDRDAGRHATGLQRLRELTTAFSPEATQPRTRVDPEVTRQLARDLAQAPSAVVYGRVGACVGGFSTLVNFLLDALNLVTGNLDREGGAVFPTPPIDSFGLARRTGLDTYATERSRIGGYPEVIGTMPAGVMADEITTPGPGQIKAMFVVAGNPLLSIPDTGALDRAFGELELVVSIDIYANETSRHADYILPGTTWLERSDFNLFAMTWQYRTFIQRTEAVVAPRGEARDDWLIFDDICAELGVVLSPSPMVRRLGQITRRLTPDMMLNALLRLGPFGDRFGLRREGWNFAKLRAQPNGVLLSPTVPTGVLRKRLKTPDKRIHVAAPEIEAEIRRLQALPEVDDEFPLLLFGRRELRSMNSWMHNSKKLNPRKEAPPLWLHPDDAAARDLSEGDEVTIRSAAGEVAARLALNPDIAVGAASLPHAWGHDGSGSWQRANETGGSNYNFLAGSGAGKLEPLASMSHLSGIHVEVARRTLRAAVGDPE